MFIYPLEESSDSAILKEVKSLFGVVPPHWQLFSKLHPKRFEMFLEEIVYLRNHPTIHPDFFAFLRLFVAHKEDFVYCKSLNTKLLLTKGYAKSVLSAFKEDVLALPLDERHVFLAQKVMKALYDAKAFGEDDIEALHERGWSDADIFDAIDHGAFLFRFSRILKAYLS